MFRFIIIIDIIIAAIDIVIVILFGIAFMMSLAFCYLSCRLTGRLIRLRRCMAFFRSTILRRHDDSFDAILIRTVNGQMYGMWLVAS